jgi:hypothetical protein
MIKEKRNSKIKTHCWQLLLFIILLFSGCEKVIDVDLNEVNPAVVIEANLTNSTNFAEVLLTKTGSYFGNSPIEQISDASVIIKDEFGSNFILDEVEKGLYRSDKILFQPEVTYQLSVEVESEKYESSSRLNPAVLIDSLTYIYDEGFAFLDPGYIVKVHFIDPPEKTNYYRIKVFENDTLRNSTEDLIVFDDRLIDGQSLEVTLRGIIFEPDDIVSIQLVSLDEGAYEYYHTFQELINVNPGSAAPANPTSNISNGALGYFSTWSADEKTVIIEE